MKIYRRNGTPDDLNSGDGMNPNVSSVFGNHVGPQAVTREEVAKLVKFYLVDEYQHPHIVEAVVNFLYQRCYVE